MALDLSGGVGSIRPGSRILLWCGTTPSGLRVAGLPLWKRAVYTACRAGFERLLIVGQGGAEKLRDELSSDSHLAGRSWEAIDAADGWASRVGRTGGRWVVLEEGWVIDAELLEALAETSGAASAAAPEGPLAAAADEIEAWARSGWTPAAPVQPAPRTTVPVPSVYRSVRGERDVSPAEEALFQGLARNVNNLFARYVDRAMSRAISRRLARTPVTPNQITIFSTLLGIVGSLVLLDPSYTAGALGAFLFFAHTVIDGCDGEIARLKFQESAAGARLDLIGDNVVHAVLFPCMAGRFYFADPGGPFLTLGAVSLAGVIVTWIVVYAIIVRGHPSALLLRFFELFANREFAYLVLVLGLAGRLEWFVWAMAFGLWIFPAGLLILRTWERSRRA